MHNKRGLSAIITTLLIVLLVLVAVGIVWGVVRGILRRGAGDIELSARCLNIEVEATAINCDTSSCVVTLTRTGSDDDEIGGVKLVFFEGTDNSGVITKQGNIEHLAGSTITEEHSLVSPDKVEVTVYLLDESGDEQFCSQTTPSSIGSGEQGEGTCDDGICHSGECDSCPDDCDFEDCCGDGTCNNGETCETCETDGCCVEDSCDGVWNPPEDAGIECDGGTGCTDCVCDMGYLPADPLGPDCEVNTDVVCGDEIFDAENEQCDDSDPAVPEDECIEPEEENECTCPDGYDPDEIGGCIEIVALISGEVDEVWPILSVMYFASSTLPQNPGDDILYSSGYYVKFPGSAEPDCLLIANYVLPFGTYPSSHIAFNSEAMITDEDSYEIWGDSTCA